MAQGIELRRGRDAQEAVKMVSSGEGKRLMEAIRNNMARFGSIEQSAADKAEAKFQADMRNLFWVISVIGLLILLTAFWLCYFVFRQGQQRLKDAILAEAQHSLDLQQKINAQLQQAHNALQFSEEQLAVTLRSIGDGMIATDVKGRVTLLNTVAEQLTGWTQAEAVGLLIGDIFPIINQYTRNPVPIRIKDALLHGTIQGMANHTVLIARDGTEFAIADSCAPIRHYDDSVIGAVLVFRDVTEEYAVQASLQESETRLNFALQITHTGGWELNMQDGTTRRTLEHDRIFGYEALLPEWTYEMFQAHVLPADRAEVDKCFRASVENKTNLDFECRIRRTDGEERWIWVSGQHQFDSTGHVKCMAGIVQDITQLKHNETALKKVYERAQLALDAGGLGDWSWDAATDQVSLGARAVQMLGFPEGSPVTLQQLRDRLLTEDADQAHDTWDKALSEHTDYHNEYRVSHPVKGSRWLAITGRANYAEDGTVLSMNGVVQDIHERKLAELAKLRLAAIVESSDDAIISKNMQGIITSWNAGAEKVFGYSADEMIGKPIRLMMPAERAGEDRQILDKISRGAKVQNFETVRVRKDGSFVDVSVTISAIQDGTGKIVGASKVARDIAERKRFEARLHEAVITADKANLAKSEFLSSMSHELRTPLNAILGFAQLLEAGSPRPTTIQERRVKEIIKAGWYLLELINEVLDLSLIESGKLSLSPEPLLLLDVMHECQSMIEPMAQLHNIQLSFLPFDNSWGIYADHTRVKQIVINLLSNAIKYNRKFGSVEIKCTLSAPQRIRITVKDTGQGLSTDQMAQLFQPFNRLGQEHGAEEGTGIGLVVTKKLVELMGGAIGVASTVGVGSEFWIEFAQDVVHSYDTEQKVPTALLANPHNIAQGTLLYVEDNPANLLLVEQIIAHSPIRILSARDAILGIDLARAHLPDIILMDINLPGMNGIKALKILQKDPLTAHIPVIALSANAMARDIEKGKEAGFFRYLTKPIKVNELMTALEEALKSIDTLCTPKIDPGTSAVASANEEE